jgi:hypothetical protein
MSLLKGYLQGPAGPWRCPLCKLYPLCRPLYAYAWMLVVHRDKLKWNVAYPRRLIAIWMSMLLPFSIGYVSWMLPNIMTVFPCILPNIQLGCVMAGFQKGLCWLKLHVLLAFTRLNQVCMECSWHRCWWDKKHCNWSTRIIVSSNSDFACAVLTFQNLWRSVKLHSSWM